MRARLVGLALASFVALVRCAAPTAIRVQVHSEVPCDKHADVALVGGTSLAELASKAPAATSTTCDADSVGEVVLQPSSDKSAEVAFELMTRPDGQPGETCADPANASACIVARRQLHFSPHDVLEVRVDLRLQCLGVVCDPTQTCVKGACVDANVIADCHGLCDESSLATATPVPPPPQNAGDAGADAGGPPNNLNPLAAGAAHTCAITPGGGVKCWGDNSRGEIGDGTNMERHVPVQVHGLTSGVVSVAAGLNFTCALMAAGNVKCWGKNDYGELGDDTLPNDSNVPHDVTGITTARSIATGCKHACASTQEGSVLCWGWNEKGQVGDQSIANRGHPIVVLASGARFVTAGFEYTCAATDAGAKCWGEDSMGQLGDSKTMDAHGPVDATALKFAPTVLTAGAEHVLAYAPAGQLPMFSTWGQDPGSGGLVATIDDASAGEGYTCALAHGGVSCWGTNNNGVLGSGSGAGSSATAVVPTGLGSNVVALRAGYDHACVQTTDGSLRCWGTNGNGQLGDTTIVGKNAPVVVQQFP
jgi:hypothetical protein